MSPQEWVEWHRERLARWALMSDESRGAESTSMADAIDRLSQWRVNLENTTELSFWLPLEHAPRLADIFQQLGLPAYLRNSGKVGVAFNYLEDLATGL